MTLIDKPTHLHDDVYNKIRGDNCGLELKNEFLSRCSSCDCELREDEVNPSDVSVERAYEEFVKDHQSSGTAISLSSEEILGRVTNLFGAARYIAKSLHQDVDDVQQMFLWLNDLCRPAPTPSQRKVAEDWFEDLKSATDPNTGSAFTISPPVCWVFRSESEAGNANEDMETDLNCLPCRLGLPDLLDPGETYRTGFDYLCLTISAESAQNTRASNFCHGGYTTVRDIWEPGGRTVPIPYGPQSCRDRGGLLEVICDAVPYSEVVGQIRVART